MCIRRFFTASLFALSLLLSSCQLVKPFVPADVIIEDAHGGGSLVRFNAQETILVSGGWAGKLRFWHLPAGTAGISWQAHDDELTGASFIQHDEALVTTGYDGWIKRWSASGTLLQQVDTHSAIRSMVLDEAEDVLITGHVDGSVRVWRLQDLRLMAQKHHHAKDIRAVTWYGPKKWIASSSFDGTVWLWPLGKPPVKLETPPSDARTLSFAEGGKTLLGGGWFHLFRWSLQNQTLQVVKTEHAGIIRNMQLVQQGKTLATISRQTDSAVLFLDPNTGKVKQRFQSHDLCGADVTVSRRHRFMATTSDDASVRIWRLDSNRTQL